MVIEQKFMPRRDQFHAVPEIINDSRVDGIVLWADAARGRDDPQADARRWA